MTIRLTIISEEPKGGAVAIVQKGGEVEEYLQPRERITVIVDDISEVVITELQD